MSETPAGNLQALFDGLQALYRTDADVPLHDLVVPLPPGDSPRELFLVRECDDGALEVSLGLDQDALRRLEIRAGHEVLSDAGLGDALPMIEGLSHLLYTAEAARQNRSVSGLELETQAEVDKLAVCLLHRWPTAPDHFGALVDRLYYQFELAPLVPEWDERYRVANRLALGFSRRLRPEVDARRLGSLRAVLREFWSASMADKHALAGV